MRSELIAFEKLESEVVLVRVRRGQCAGRDLSSYPVGKVVHPCLFKEAGCKRLDNAGDESCQVPGFGPLIFSIKP